VGARPLSPDELAEPSSFTTKAQTPLLAPWYCMPESVFALFPTKFPTAHEEVVLTPSLMSKVSVDPVVGVGNLVEVN
jgi:hypothetical protein